MTPSAPAAPRPAARLTFALTVILLAAHLLWVLVAWGSEGFRLTVSALIYIPTFLLGGATCILNAPRAPHDASAWRTLGAGLVSFGLGQGIYAYLLLVLKDPPFPSAADALFLLALALYAWGFLRFRRTPGTTLERLRLGVDVAVIIAAVGVFAWKYVLYGVLTGYAGQPLAAIIGLTYPFGDLALLSVLLLVALRGGAPLGARDATLGFGLACLIVADQAFIVLGANGTYQEGSWVDVFWAAGATLFALASFAPTTTQRPSRRPALVQHTAPYLPYLALGAAFALLISGDRSTSAAQRGVLWGTVLVTALVVVRQIIAFTENARLTDALRRLSGELEGRVQERTRELDVANTALRGLTEDLELKVRERTAELEASQARLAHQAQHDVLTGLPNRALFQDRVERGIASAAREGGRLAVMFIDLDGFKAVNDTLGHAAGDELLREVASRLQDNVRRNDTVARLGGDEFTVMLLGVNTAQDAASVAQKILRALREPIHLADGAAHVSGSIGVSLYPQDGADATDLQRHADIAMYRAKQGGKNNITFYAPEMNAVDAARSAVEQHLRGALDRHELTLAYQPLHNAQGLVVGVEALLRWQNAALGNVPPTTFIPVAEDTGLIIPIGQYVLNEACRQLAAWRAHGTAVDRMSVNVSPAQFAREDFVDIVRRALQHHRLDGRDLELELTERLIIRDVPGVSRKMSELRALGVRLSIDDFGAGNSALNYLMTLPVNTLKVDRAFVQALDQTPGAHRIVQAIVALGHALGLDVVAEGVETPAQLLQVRELGCERTQGFLLGQPVPPENIRA
ncbi:putative bifunctional diguanylate cyclase/phosphodiesterase [Deinococcus maricopensis]|uniref:Diguanylate cyclase/phosphodiesterase n=1 Tax=Deinococcus maricopensis (strain DSM 21211 / LMG 22137 / NRRL B-23946 / LB-34) TaxID=709986 RepID=E8U8C4_DEIML|nr:EAL domain-containing protein [Deinococcus maricopensis]ADV67313.1 diguanylate cyclase/phosphodiesterase [Deinococcus maricopensis DSM 21211]